MELNLQDLVVCYIYGHHATVSLFGCVNAQNGEFLCMETQRCNAQTFLAFLRSILAMHEEKHIVMILDNAWIHHAKLLKPFLKENEHHLTFLFLPPYSPNLNAVERIWGWLKGSSSIGFTPQEKRFENQCSPLWNIWILAQRKYSNVLDH